MPGTRKPYRLSPDSRPRLAQHFVTRGFVHVHDTGLETFWARWGRLTGPLGLVLGIGTSALVVWLLPVPALRWVLGALIFPFAGGVWTGIVGTCVVLVHGFRPVAPR